MPDAAEDLLNDLIPFEPEFHALTRALFGIETDVSMMGVRAVLIALLTKWREGERFNLPAEEPA